MSGNEQTPGLPDQRLILRAICDPGHFLPRGDHHGEPYGESIQHWSMRAVQQVIGEWLAGRTVLELPAPSEQDPAMWEAADGANPYWRVDPDLDDYGPWVRCQLGHHYLDPANASRLGAALIAGARESERLASKYTEAGDSGE
jgi:hypothetical protein